jgi:PleD family two-component response regulator
VERIFSSLDCDYKGLEVTVSMGIAKCVGGGTDDFDVVYAKAENALLQAKKNGKHSYYAYNEKGE